MQLLTKSASVTGPTVGAKLAVSLSSDGVVTLATVGNKILGLAGDDQSAYRDQIDIVIAGIASGIASEAINAGALVAADAGGQLKNAATTDQVFGSAFCAAATGGVVFDVLIGR